MCISISRTETHGGWANMTTRSVVLCCPAVFGWRMLFQRRLCPQSCRHATPGIPNVSHGNVRNENGIVRTLEEWVLGTNAVPVAVWGIFSQYGIPEVPKNKRTEYFWGRSSADAVAACYLYNSYITWWTHQGAYISVMASMVLPSHGQP